MPQLLSILGRLCSQPRCVDADGVVVLLGGLVNLGGDHSHDKSNEQARGSCCAVLRDLVLEVLDLPVLGTEDLLQPGKKKVDQADSGR